jgi:signal transduction histidine kinase
VIQVDESSIRRAIISLLRKAGDDSPEAGEVRIRAIVEADQNDPGFVMLQISDSGEGIPIEDLPKVFSRLKSKDGSRTNKSHQKWMDLTTIKAVIEAHGGRIWVDSSIGEGSTYSTLLPIPSD